MNKRKPWMEAELLLMSQAAQLVKSSKATQYEVCKRMTVALDRTWESVRSKLKELLRG